MARLTFLGTGDAFHAGGRRHSSYLLEEGGGRLAVDFGSTALLSLRLAGIDPRTIGAVAITHLHGDHVAGLPFLLLDGKLRGPRTEPLAIAGAVGLERRLYHLIRGTYDEILPVPYPLTLSEIRPGESIDLAGFEVRAFAADHMDPPHRPLSLRVRTKSGRVVAFSGDTSWSEELVRCAEGVDLLVCECTGLAPPFGRHLTWSELRVKAPRLNAKRIVLSHLGEGVREAVEGVHAADDGEVVEL